MSHLRHMRSRQGAVILVLAAVVWGVNARWVAPRGFAATVNGSDAAGVMAPAAADGKACISCHRSIVESFGRTAHFHSSAPASPATIMGSFRGGHNRFVYNDKMEVVMEKKHGVYLQSGYFNGNLFESEAFDIVIGCRKGQTYLYWDNNRLFQLPISYYAPANSWCNSPGYPTNLLYYNKQVPGECMECHATSASLSTADDGSVIYDRSSLVLGIGCERCHGDAARHIAWHNAHPEDSLKGRFIISARYMARQRRLDACALCHSGLRKQLMPSFSFQVGDTLNNYSVANYDTAHSATLDVHGNQYGLLTSSKCFLRSAEFDCSSCHNVHVNDAGNMQAYSQRCMSCHNGTAGPGCASTEVRKMAHVTNCIDCHMPALPSNKILLELRGDKTPVADLVRTHRIAIYPDISKAWLHAAGAATGAGAAH